MYDVFNNLWLRLHHRDSVDQELRQAVVRIVISSIAVSLSLALGEIYGFETEFIAFCYSLHLSVSVGVFYWVLMYPGDYFARKFFTIFLDIGGTSVTVYDLGFSSMFVYPLYLWIIVGNGMRFGVKYLYLCLIAAVSLFTLSAYLSPHWVDQFALVLSLDVGFIVLSLFYTRLISQLHVLNDRLGQELKRAQHASLHDALTDLPNRTYFSQKMSEVISNSKVDGNFFAVAYLDLNNFKPVNDNYGHEFGDVLLQQVSQRLRDALQEHDFAARLGGDEFGLIITSDTDLSAVIESLNEISGYVNQPYIVFNARIEISVSVGLACYPTDGNTESDLLKQADRNMYLSKNSRNGLQLRSAG